VINLLVTTTGVTAHPLPLVQPKAIGMYDDFFQLPSPSWCFRYNGHFYWGMYLNNLLNNPRGRMDLMGNSRIVTYTFKLVREGPRGRTVTPLPVDLHSAGDRDKAAEVPQGVLAKFVQTTKEIDEALPQIMVPAPGTQET
jgi:hypothetical protein